MDPLDRLRTEITRVDAEIADLLARRQDLAREVGTTKAAEGRPIRDFTVEKKVLERYRAACLERNLDPRWGEGVARELIRGAILVQEDLHGSIPAGTLRDVVIVGGAGKMGAWLGRFLRDRGHPVRVCDPAGTPEGFAAVDLDAARTAEIVVLATPLDASGALLERIVDLGPSGLVFDLCSLKAPVATGLERARREGVRVTSLHPMFGPGVEMLSGRSVLVCDCGDPVAAAEAEELFADTALAVKRIPLAEHDRLMSVMLGMSHALAIVGAAAFAGTGARLEDFAGAESTTFHKLARTLSEVTRENPDLYHEIQHRNPATGEVYRAIEEAVTRVREASLADDPAAFEAVLAEGRAWFGEREF